MTKKEYQKPAMRAVVLQQQSHLLADSNTFSTVKTNSGSEITYEGLDEEYSGGAR